MDNNLLETVFGFDSTDLSANRLGRLSERQRGMIAPYVRSGKTGGDSPLPVILLIFGVLAAAGWAYFTFIRPLSSALRATYTLFVLGGAGFIVFLLLFMMWAVRRARGAAAAAAKANAADPAGPEVKVARGEAQAGFGTEYGAGSVGLRDTSRLMIGGKVLAPFWAVGWHARLPEAFEPGRTYTAYYVTLRHPAGYSEDLVISMEG